MFQYIHNFFFLSFSLSLFIEYVMGSRTNEMWIVNGEYNMKKRGPAQKKALKTHNARLLRKMHAIAAYSFSNFDAQRGG